MKFEIVARKGLYCILDYKGWPIFWGTELECIRHRRLITRHIYGDAKESAQSDPIRGEGPFDMAGLQPVGAEACSHAVRARR